MTKAKKKAPRNRTLTITDEERNLFRKSLFFPKGNDLLTLDSIRDKTIVAELSEVIERLPDAFANLIILDPPYNLSRDFHGFKFHATSDDNYYDYLKSWFSQIVAKLKPNGSLYLCGDWKNTAALQRIMSEHLHVMNRITWQREKGRGAKTNWKNSMEDIWFGVKDEKNYYFDVEAVKMKRRVLAPYRKGGKPKDWEETEAGNFRLTHPSNFWDDISVPFWSMPENTDHPTQKPEKLIAKLILASSKEGDVVFDPFLGSGTTSVVAKKLGRHYVGIEMNEEYALWAEKRLQRAEENREIQGYKDGVFWERNTLSEQQKKKG